MCLWEQPKESERTHTSVSPGDVAKNKQLLKPSGVWAASVCSPPPSLRPSSPHLPSLHLSITHTHTHTVQPHTYALSYAPITVYTNAHTHQLHPAASLLYFLRRRPPVWQSAAQEKRAGDTEKRLKKGQNRVRRKTEWGKRAEERCGVGEDKCENVLKLSPTKTDLEGQKSLFHHSFSIYRWFPSGCRL